MLFRSPFSKISRINRELGRLITIRTKQPGFHPNGDQHVLMISPDIFAVLRISPGGGQHILTLTNVTGRVCHIEIPLSELRTDKTDWYDLVSGMEWTAEDKKLYITLQPYDVIWLEPFDEKKASTHSAE